MPFAITEETASSDQKPVFSENVFQNAFLPPTSLNPSQVVAVEAEAEAVSLIYAAKSGGVGIQIEN